MNILKAEKQAREILIKDFEQNNGLTINGRFFKNLKSLRSNDRIAYRDLIDCLVWSPIDYDLRVHPTRLDRF